MPRPTESLSLIQLDLQPISHTLMFTDHAETLLKTGLIQEVLELEVLLSDKLPGDTRSLDISTGKAEQSEALLAHRFFLGATCPPGIWLGKTRCHLASGLGNVNLSTSSLAPLPTHRLKKTEFSPYPGHIPLQLCLSSSCMSNLSICPPVSGSFTQTPSSLSSTPKLGGDSLSLP